MIWNLKCLMESANSVSTCSSDGQDVPARPINYRYETLWERLKGAWLVFRGKADAVIWPDNQ